MRMAHNVLVVNTSATMTLIATTVLMKKSAVSKRNYALVHAHVRDISSSSSLIRGGGWEHGNLIYIPQIVCLHRCCHAIVQQGLNLAVVYNYKEGECMLSYTMCT